MSLTPMDIHQKEFKGARLGGYNEEDVDAFLDLIADELEKLIGENESFKVELDALRKKLSEFEEMQSSLQSALITATKSAEDVKTQSRHDAEEVLLKARKEAESIIRYAQDESGRILGDAKNEETRIHRKLDKVRKLKKQYLESINQIAEVQIKQVKELEEKDKQLGLAAEEIAPLEESVEIINSVLPEMKATENLKEVEAAAAVAEKPAVPVIEAQMDKPAEPVEPQGGNTDLTGGHASAPTEQAKASENPPQETMKAVDQSARQVENANPQQNSVEKAEIKKQDLVQEVLGVDFGDDIYSGLEDFEEEKASSKRIFGRRDKKDKNQFWE